MVISLFLTNYGFICQLEHILLGILPYAMHTYYPYWQWDAQELSLKICQNLGISFFFFFSCKNLRKIVTFFGVIYWHSVHYILVPY